MVEWQTFWARLHGSFCADNPFSHPVSMETDTNFGLCRKLLECERHPRERNSLSLGFAPVRTRCFLLLLSKVEARLETGPANWSWPPSCKTAVSLQANKILTTVSMALSCPVPNTGAIMLDEEKKYVARNTVPQKETTKSHTSNFSRYSEF